jgi:hypothetical protein
MAKRRHKIEPISLEEITDSPSLEGYDQFLRYRPEASNPDGEAQLGEVPIVETPIGIEPIGNLPLFDQPVPELPGHDHFEGPFTATETPIGESPIYSPSLAPLPGRRQKIRRAESASDGHSPGEQLVYEVLWKEGTIETEESRIVTIGYGGLQELCRLDRTNCKKNLASLAGKLAIEIVDRYDVKTNRGNTYRVYSPSAVLRRRRNSGLEYVIKTSGVRFVRLEEAEHAFAASRARRMQLTYG